MMKWFGKLIQGPSQVTKYRIRRIIFISLAWTLVDLIIYLRNASAGDDIHYPYLEISFTACLLRVGIVLVVSFLMSWLLLKEIKIEFSSRTLVIGLVVKAILLLLIAVAAAIVIFFLDFLIIKKVSFTEIVLELQNHSLYTHFATDSLFFWLVMLLSALIIVEIDRKYSP